jgi:hypothetical protein
MGSRLLAGPLRIFALDGSLPAQTPGLPLFRNSPKLFASMDTSLPTNADAPIRSSELSEPKTVRKVLAITGAILTLVSAILLIMAKAQLQREIEREVGMSLEEFRKLPEDVWSVVETERENVLIKRRAAFGSTLAAGLLLLLLAAVTQRRLRASVATALVVVIISAVLFGILAKRKRDWEAEQPAEQTPPEMRIEKAVVWTCLIGTFAALLWAGRVAAGYHHRETLASPPPV